MMVTTTATMQNKSAKVTNKSDVAQCFDVWSQVCLATPLLSATMDLDFPLLPLLPPLRLRSNLDFNLWNLDFNLDSALHKNI